MDLTPETPKIDKRSDQEPGFCWAVVFSNYEPAEVDNLFATRDLAERRAEQLGDDWCVERWAIQGWAQDRAKDRQAAYRAGREDAARALLRAYADRHHYLAGGHGPISTPGGWIDPDAWCACGAAWSDDEGGCSERIQLLEAISLGRSVGRDGDNPSGQP